MNKRPKTNLNTSPYFDDYDPSKHFQQILFKPRPVQARELNQLQTILQNQVSRTGDHLFNDGALVIPGGVSSRLDQNYSTIDFLSGSQLSDITSRENLKCRSRTSLLDASIVFIVGAENGDDDTIYVDYNNSGVDNSTLEFNTNEIIDFFIIDNGSEIIVSSARIITSGKGSLATVDQGVYYVRGIFTQNEYQTIPIEKYSTSVNARVGFTVTEKIVTSSEDETLLSNAQGTTNYKASGADRFVIDLTLSVRELNTDTSDDFIELLRLKNGTIQRQVVNTDYSLLERTLAQRTFEESGNYTVQSFGLDLREHLKDGNNEGVFPPPEGDPSKLVAAVKAGIAYVQGYRVENQSTVFVPFDKARDTAIINNSVTGAEFGNYIIAEDPESLPVLDITKQFNLYDGALVGGNPTGNIIGTTRVRSFRNDSNGNIRLYVFDTEMTLGTFNQVLSIGFNDTSNRFAANVFGSTIFDSAKNRAVFQLPIQAIKTLKENGISDTSYTVMREFNTITDGNGVATLSVGSSELFSPVNTTEYAVAETGSANTGTIYDYPGMFTLSGTPLGRSLVVDITNANPNTEIKIIAPVIKQQPQEKTKTLVTRTQQVNFFADNAVPLDRGDIVRVNSITDASTGNDISSLFVVDNGIRDSYYDLGTLATIDNLFITATIDIEYEFFEHSAGDYFSVDSYTIPYDDIPVYTASDGTEFDLRDALDFRPIKVNGGFTAASLSGEMIRPNDTIRADIEYFLPRIDILYLNGNGVFAVKKGISSNNPAVPSTPNDGMKLYDLRIPPYTFSPEDVEFTQIDNRRYTMRDIGEIEQRVSNLEYYTTLTQLESETNDIQVLDPVTGNNRFKNGFTVDPFDDFRLSDVESPEWSASIDYNNGILRPSFVDNAVDQSLISGTNYIKNNSLASLAYTDVEEISQPYATTAINVNPYNAVTWQGSINLTPANDFWRDNKNIEPIIVNRTINTRGAAIEGATWDVWRESNDIITTTTTTKFTESLQTSQQQTVVKTETIPYMRTIDITFDAKNFKPFTKIYPFFDNESIGSFCKPVNGAYGADLITDVNGSFIGVFTVPNNQNDKFRTGVSSFRLTDNSIDSRNVNEFSTSGETQFRSGGTLDTNQQTITSTRILSAETQTDITRVRWRDPVAQSFIVNPIGGMYATKIDLYFKSKSSNIPVTVELRVMENGLPTNRIVPLSQVTLNPDDVNVSEDGGTPTTFNFNDIVFLQEATEYAVVVLADTQEYEIYISELGGKVIGEDRVISKQPTLGSLFTSQNGSTWSPIQNQDLKFILHRASFSSTDAIINVGCTSPIPQPTGFNAIITTSNSSILTVNLKSHGLKVGDNVVISGATGGNAISPTVINTTHTVLSATIDTFNIDVGVQSNTNGTIGGGSMLITANFPFSYIYSNINNIQLEDTNINYEYAYIQQSNRALSVYRPFNPNDNTLLPNEGVITQSNDLLQRITLSSERENLSPVIDFSAYTTALISPRVNNDENNIVANYISRNIQFDNPSTSSRIFIGAKLPGNTSIKLFYKLIVTGDENLNILPWTELQPDTPLVNDDKQFLEYVYNINDVGSYVGYKLRVAMLSDDNTILPELTDIRSISLA